MITAYSNSNKTELLDPVTWSWSVTEEYPSNWIHPHTYDTDLIYAYPYFYLIGGKERASSTSLANVHRFHEFERTWTANVGQLATPRTNHSYGIETY